MKGPILVWRYYEAPAELQISGNGGDEDWLAELPPEYLESTPLWLDYGGAFGCCGVEQLDHPTKPGWKIFIGSHS